MLEFLCMCVCRELADGPREDWSESVIENYIISAVHNCTISRVRFGEREEEAEESGGR